MRPVLKELQKEHWITLIKYVGDYQRIRVNDEKMKAAADARIERKRIAREIRVQLEMCNPGGEPLSINECFASDDPGKIVVLLGFEAPDDKIIGLVRQISQLVKTAT